MHIEPIKVEDAKREIEEIEQKIKKMEELSRRKLLLQNYLTILESLRSETTGGATPIPFPSSPETPTPAATVPSKNDTQQVALKILSAHGAPMHMDILVPAMREAGWIGTGNDKLDKNRVYQAMHRRKDLFAKTRESTWKAKVNLEKKIG